MSASDADAERVWAIIESRQPKPEIGTTAGTTVRVVGGAYTSSLVFEHPTPIQAAAHCERLKAAVESGAFRLAKMAGAAADADHHAQMPAVEGGL